MNKQVNTMLRILIACALIHIAVSQSSTAFGNAFDDSNNKDIEALKCSGIEGTAQLCMACYTCNDEKVRNRKNLYHLTLKDGNCTTTDVCCIASEDLIARDNTKCGTANPEGLPRRRRPTLKSVLEREYPWRAWVYSTEDLQTPICAASYVDSAAKALLTTASCVSGRQPSTLVVKFTKRQNPLRLKDVIVHENFDRATRKNDTALLILPSSPGEYVHPICYIHPAPPFGSSCVAVSDSETYINLIIPDQKKCSSADKNMDDTLMCTTSHGADYKPPEGAGIYCLEDQGKTPKYFLYGISLNVHKERFSFHANVPHFAEWIQQQTAATQSTWTWGGAR